MGTSTSNGGQKGNTPLVPSWLSDTPDEQPTKPQEGDPKRFTEPRSNFTRYVNDGGGDNLRRATSHYVRNSLQGSQNATTRLGSARSSTARLVSIFNSFATQGAARTQSQFNLGDIIGKRASDALLLIMDFVCPDGGSTDEGIARHSYIEAMVSMPDLENKTIEELSPPEFLAFTEIYMSNVIEGRLINDIGNKLFSLPDNVAQVDNLQRQIKDYITGAVSDAMSRLNVDIARINSSQAQSIVDSIYKKAYDIMAELEE